MPTNYNGYVIPVDADVADAPKAFTDFTDSIPFSDFVEVVEVSAATRTVEDADNGKMLFVKTNSTLTFSTLTDGFSAAVVADTGVTVTFAGVDAEGATTSEYEVATVVTVNGTNVLTLPGEAGDCPDCPECPECPDPIGPDGLPFEIATITTAPTKVSGENDVVVYDVKTTDGANKKLYALLGNTNTNAAPTVVGDGIEVMSYRTEPAVFQVTLSTGRLPGVMIASGGPGGYNNGPTFYGGGGGSGGVVGLGCNMPVFLNKTAQATYEITVGGTSISDNENHVIMYGQSTDIAAQGEEPFMAAVGGGGGLSVRGGQYVQPYNGGSGGGGMGTAADGDLSSNFGRPGDGVPGQGNPGGLCKTPYGGGGGGYNGPGNVFIGSDGPFTVNGAAGGPGMSVTAALGLDEDDTGVQAFMAACTANGMIAGGGSTTTTDVIDGGASRGNPAQDWTGGGGGGGNPSVKGGNGGAGAVYLLGDA